MIWTCSECGTNFESDRSTACLQCGSIDIIACKPDKAKEGRSEASSRGKKEDMRNILKELCSETYEASFRGVEWDQAIERALSKMKPYLAAPG